VTTAWVVDPVGVGQTGTGADGRLQRVAWVRDRYVVGGTARTIRIWDSAVGVTAGSALPGGPDFAVSRDNRLIATFEPDSSELLLWATRPVMPYLD
jgi:hypothetical protein